MGSFFVSAGRNVADSAPKKHKKERTPAIIKDRVIKLVKKSWVFAMESRDPPSPIFLIAGLVMSAKYFMGIRCCLREERRLQFGESGRQEREY